MPQGGLFIKQLLARCRWICWWYCPQMKAIHEGRVITNNFDRFDHDSDTAFHFDATKLANG